MNIYLHKSHLSFYNNTQNVCYNNQLIPTERETPTTAGACKWWAKASRSLQKLAEAYKKKLFIFV